MTEKKYQVFISSTYSDLVNERRKVFDILLMADCIPAGMEAFVATDNEQFEVIKKVIDLCDYYILILGKRYGSVNANTGISYTEMEYEYAKSKGIPVLVFAIDDTIVLPFDKQEHDEKNVEKLKRFRENAMKNRLASIWRTTDDLTGKLAIAIMNAKSEMPRSGWQRATDYDEAMLRRKIMELQRENDSLAKNLDDAQRIISSLTEHTDIAFDECTIDIEYSFYNSVRNGKNKITVGLPELFSIIATEMMYVSITERQINDAITKSKLFPQNGDKYIEDDQLVKRVLNQLKALKFIDSFWSKEKSVLYWSLTEKGRKVRDDMILVRNK